LPIDFQVIYIQIAVGLLVVLLPATRLIIYKIIIMISNQKLAGVLNDLIQINNDRITGYEKAAKETESKDADLQSVFSKMADESRLYKEELSAEVVRLGEEPSTDTTNLGTIYRMWMDVKATFTGHDRKSILGSCEFGEDAAQKAYKSALETLESEDSEIYHLVNRQKTQLKVSHDQIKQYRDIAVTA
jgi:uncharacterized protein (TIGR02284 family)